MGIVIADCVARPVGRVPAAGELELVDEIGLFLGGSAANTGIALARLGLRVALVGQLGRDGFGDFLEGAARAAGCDTRFLRRGEVPTSATLVNVDAAGERSFLHAVGAGARLRAADVPLAGLAAEGARALHVAGYFVLPGLEPDLPGLFGQATELGLLTSLDTVWDATGRWPRVHAALPHTDVFCPSLPEARHITGCSEPGDVLDALLGLGVRRVAAVKMGPQGALIGRPDGTRLHLSAAPVRAVDGTGAGDAFIGGLLAGLLRDEGLEAAGRLGSAAGALCVGAMGATAGLQGLAPTRALADTLRADVLRRGGLHPGGPQPDEHGPPGGTP
ncbi:carbohydrate kinase family protein [Deinococcus koreensis]|uniref:Carbohydrate kinase family protein n=1 Tax=Deinococcus koreensis TaxID=2054903 RepID=A0A2K3UTR7_9DEIO|nr:carbohydrate kinase family protein [Deinococcus koreensis]